MTAEKLNPIQIFVEAVKELAVIKDPDLKKSLFKLGDVVSSDSVIADYEPSSDAETALEDFKLELGEYEARLLAETEAEVEAALETPQEADDVPLEVDESDEEEEVPLIEDEDTTTG